MATLATALTRHSLIIGVACKFAIRRLLVCLSTLKPLRTPCACRTAPVPLFPQRAVQAQLGRYASAAALATALMRHSLIIGVVCRLALRRLRIYLCIFKTLSTPCTRHTTYKTHFCYWFA